MKTLSQNPFRLLTLLVIIQILLITNCTFFQGLKRDDFDFSTPPSATAQIEVVNQELESIRDHIFSSEETLASWEEKTAFFQPESEWGGWVSQLRFESETNFDVNRYIENPIRLPHQPNIRGFFIVKNAWKQPHGLRIVFLLDFQQIPVLMLAKEQSYHDISVLQSQEERAFEFVLSGLTEGFHQLSILQITDPDTYYTDDFYRTLQQKSLSENRYDLWVNIDEPPGHSTIFESQEIGQAASGRIGSIDLVEFSGKALPMKSISALTGEEVEIKLRLFNCGQTCQQTYESDMQYQASIPVKIGVFWNDFQTLILEYDLEAEVPDELVFTTHIIVPSEPDTYYLSIVGFALPGYSQFDESLTRVVFPSGLFSQRIKVVVQPQSSSTSTTLPETSMPVSTHLSGLDAF